MANKPLPKLRQWPTTDSAMADRIRAFDWERTPLGPIACWPQSLRTTVDILLASGHAMQLAWGAERTILYNDAYAPMLGERHPDALGLPFREAWPEIWGEIEPLVDQVFAGDTVRFDDMPLTMTRNGQPEETWWTFSYSPVRDECGAVAGLLNVTVDSTPKVLGKQTEAALRESDTRHRLLVGSWAQAVWETDEAGVVVADSPSWRAYTGQILEEWLGDGWLGAVHPDDRAYAERQWWEAIASRSPVDAEFRLCAPDGEFRWTNVRAAPVLDAEGAVEKWVGMNIDIDGRKCAEAALRESEERQAFLLKLSDALRPIGDPIAVQEAAARLLCEAMQADRCYYAEFDWPGDVLHIHHECVRSGAVSAIGSHPISAFQDLLQFSHEGRPLVCDNIATHPTFKSEVDAYRARGTDGFILVPLVKGGVMVACICVTMETPRAWTPAEVALAGEVAERTWAAVERAHAEAALRATSENFYSLIQNSPMGVYVVDADFRIVQASMQAHRTFGAAVDPLIGADVGDALRTIWEEPFASQATGRFRTALDTGAPYVAREITERRADSDALEGYDWRVERIVMPDGRFGIVCYFYDQTEHQQLERALRESEERLRQFGEASQDVLWIRDAETLQWQYLTPAFETIYGMSREEALAGNNYRNWLDLIVPDDRERAMDGIRRVQGGERATFEFRIERASDGTIRWLRNTDFPITDASGKVVLIGGIGHDATDLKRAQERQDTLLAELQHRVRNILAVIRSIVSRSDDGERDTEGYVQHLQGRISALARTQVLLTRQAGTGVDLEDLIRDELLAQAASEQQFALAGPEVRLSAKAAEVLTLAIHELATNATKYGAFSRTDGRLDIRWSVETRDDQNWLVLDWTERGVPIVDTAPRRRGFGAELVSRRIPYELKGHGQFELRPGGLQSHIEFPLVAGDSILQTDGVSR